MRKFLIHLLGGYTEADKDKKIVTCLHYLCLCNNGKDEELDRVLKERFNYYKHKLKDEED
jgi:hypothetical protein